MPEFTYTVYVTAEHRRYADQVITERIGYDEDLGFDYKIDTKPIYVTPGYEDHFAEKHPGEEIQIDVWWSIPYRHSSELVDGVLVVHSETGRSGEDDSDNEYYCALCYNAIDIGDLEIDYV